MVILKCLLGHLKQFRWPKEHEGQCCGEKGCEGEVPLLIKVLAEDADNRSKDHIAQGAKQEKVA